MDKQKNILFIMTDELRADVTGFGGNCIIRTPNLDRLAAKATVFDNAYTPSAYLHTCETMSDGRTVSNHL